MSFFTRLALVAVLAFVSACGNAGPKSSPTVWTGLTDLGLWMITYQIKDERLDFAVIQGPAPKDQEIRGRVEINYSAGQATFHHPDGRKIRLDGSGLLLTVNGDTVTVIPIAEKISARELQDFFDSSPQDYSAEALLRFCAEKRAP